MHFVLGTATSVAFSSSQFPEIQFLVLLYAFNRLFNHWILYLFFLGEKKKKTTGLKIFLKSGPEGHIQLPYRNNNKISFSMLQTQPPTPSLVPDKQEQL